MSLLIISPSNDSLVVAGIPIEILANLQSENNTKRVDFYINSLKVGERINPPYNVFYKPQANGILNIKAVGFLQAGGTIESEIINITVVEPSPVNSVNSPPIVKLFDPATLNAGQTITLTAKGSDDGTITKVEFYANSMKIGEALTNPYKVNWTPNAGDYTLTVLAYDDKGAFTTGNPIKVNIGNNPPSVLTVITEGSNDNVALNSNWLLL